MNSVDKQAVLHCLKSMIDEEVCEECPLYGTTGTDHCEKDCVRLAINALEQEPCEDAISRQVAINIVKDMRGLARADVLSDAVKQLKELPHVTPQPKRGRWIKYGVPRCGEQHYQCTSCKYYINFGQWGELYTKEFKYCPNCGAKMQEVEND